MASVFDEGSLRFSFGETWRAVKYDDHRDYRAGIGRLPATRAVDFVAIGGNDALFFVEVKDFRGFRIAGKARLAGNDLVVEVAHKVRDTIAGLVAARRRSSTPDLWRPFVASLVDPERRLCVVLWLEQDRPPTLALARRRVVSRGALTKVLKQKLRWLNTKVAVLEKEGLGLPDLEVASLARAEEPSS